MKTRKIFPSKYASLNEFVGEPKSIVLLGLAVIEFPDAVILILSTLNVLNTKSELSGVPIKLIYGFVPVFPVKLQPEVLLPW